MTTVVYVIDPFTNTKPDAGDMGEKVDTKPSDSNKSDSDDNGQFMVRALADIISSQSQASRKCTVLQIVPASEVIEEK